MFPSSPLSRRARNTPCKHSVVPQTTALVPRSPHARSPGRTAIGLHKPLSSVHALADFLDRSSVHDGSSVDAAYCFLSFQFILLLRSPRKSYMLTAFHMLHVTRFNAIGGAESFYAIDVVNSAFTPCRLFATSHRLG